MVGSGDNGQLTFIDMLSILSFMVGVQNLDANLTQNDKFELQNELSDKSDVILKEIHSHLKEQDAKLNLIMDKLGIQYDERRDI